MKAIIEKKTDFDKNIKSLKVFGVLIYEKPICLHPTRRREYYKENTYKCFGCNKIIFEK